MLFKRMSGTICRCLFLSFKISKYAAEAYRKYRVHEILDKL